MIAIALLCIIMLLFVQEKPASAKQPRSSGDIIQQVVPMDDDFFNFKQSAEFDDTEGSNDGNPNDDYLDDLEAAGIFPPASSPEFHQDLHSKPDLPQTPPYDKTKARAFADKYCDLTGEDHWFPTSLDHEYQLRAPYFVLPGVRKSGTTSLSSYIGQHPRVTHARTKELQFFMKYNFEDKFVRPDDGKTMVKAARDAMYSTEYNVPELKDNTHRISTDATPGYILHSSMIPQRLLCVCPWTKLVVILRDPVSRAYSNYQYNFRERKEFPKERPRPSFEQTMENDIGLLQQSGFLTATTPEDEETGWNKYLTIKTSAIVGRSFYEIQLRQWFRAYRELGREPSKEIYFVRTEDMKNDLHGKMRGVFEFLGLQYVDIQHEEAKVVGGYEPMKETSQERLKKMFKPYNQKLYKFLQEEGFGYDWVGYWEKKI